MRAIIIFLVALYTVVSARAELRVWTDQSGKSIEAEHVSTLSDKVVLRKADGTQVRVSLETLSERDRKYAILKTPPRLDISVSPKNDRSNTGMGGSRRGWQISDESIVVEASVKKSSSLPYDALLEAELFLLGGADNKEGYIVFDIARSEFKLTTSSPHSFDSKEVTLQQREAGETRGIQYEGYFLVVRDENDTIISTKSSKLAFEKHADAILAAQIGTVFDEDFKVAGRKRNKSKEKSERQRVPGRRF